MNSLNQESIVNCQKLRVNCSSSRGGAAAFSVVLVISTIVFLVTTAGVLISIALTGLAYNEHLSSESLASARTGAQDAIMRIVRDKNFLSAGSSCPSPCSYSIAISSGRTVDVTVTSTSSGFEVISTGLASGRRKVIRAELGVDTTTGEVNVHFFREDFSL